MLYIYIHIAGKITLRQHIKYFSYSSFLGSLCNCDDEI